jgi:hypothetical protein
VQLVGFHLLAQDGIPCLVVRWLQVYIQAAFKAASEPVRQVLEFRGRPVAGENHLLVGIVQGVEGMEQLLLGAFLVLEEVDVIYQQQIHRAVAVLEGRSALAMYGVDEVVGEVLRGYADYLELRIEEPGPVAYGLHQMGLAQSYTAVDEEGVVGSSGIGGYGHGSIGCKGVVFSYDIVFEAVIQYQLCMLLPGTVFLGLYPGLVCRHGWLSLCRSLHAGCRIHDRVGEKHWLFAVGNPAGALPR